MAFLLVVDFARLLLRQKDQPPIMNTRMRTPPTAIPAIAPLEVCLRREVRLGRGDLDAIGSPVLVEEGKFSDFDLAKAKLREYGKSVRVEYKIAIPSSSPRREM